jgi:hypothetical protein
VLKDKHGTVPGAVAEGASTGDGEAYRPAPWPGQHVSTCHALTVAISALCVILTLLLALASDFLSDAL